MADNNFDNTVKKSKKHSMKMMVAAIVCALAVVAAGFYFCTSELFFVKKIDVKDVSNGEYKRDNPYTDEEMLKGLEIEIGTGLYSFDKKKAESNVKYNLPHIKEIKLSRRWPSTVVAKVEYENPAFYISVSDKLYILSENLKVIEKTETAETIEVDSLVFLETGKVDNCIVGEMLGIPEDSIELVEELRKTLDEYSVLRNVKLIDISDKFDVSLMYDSRFEVKLGDSKNLGTKIDFMKRIIADRGDVSPGGTIDVSNVESKEAVYKKFG